MQLSRRAWFAACLAAPAAFGARRRVRIGVTDWNLGLTGELEALALAKKIGFDGLEVSIGRQPHGDSLPLADTELQRRYVATVKEVGIPIASTCLDILHVNYLKNDKLGQKWVRDGIAVTKNLGTRVMLLPFFGKGALSTRQEQDYVGDVLRDLGPQAAAASVILAVENTISAEDNARILERARSKAVKVFYDTGNSYRQGFDPAKEIRWLGKDRIAAIHLKDNPGYMGEGKIDFPAVMKAITDIGYDGFADLETDSPSKNIEADMRRNLDFTRKLLA